MKRTKHYKKPIDDRQNATKILQKTNKDLQKTYRNKQNYTKHYKSLLRTNKNRQNTTKAYKTSQNKP